MDALGLLDIRGWAYAFACGVVVGSLVCMLLVCMLVSRLRVRQPKKRVAVVYHGSGDSDWIEEIVVAQPLMLGLSANLPLAEAQLDDGPMLLFWGGQAMGGAPVKGWLPVSGWTPEELDAAGFGEGAADG